MEHYLNDVVVKELNINNYVYFLAVTACGGSGGDGVAVITAYKPVQEGCLSKPIVEDPVLDPHRMLVIVDQEVSPFTH